MMIFVAGFIAGCIVALSLIYILACFEERDGAKQCFRIGSPVIVTEGPYQGMHGTIIGTSAFAHKFFIHFPAQAGTETDFVHLEKRILRVNVPEEMPYERRYEQRKAYLREETAKSLRKPE